MVRDRLDLLRKRKVIAPAGILFAQLDECCAACARRIDCTEQGLDGVVGAVRDNIKGRIKLQDVYKRQPDKQGALQALREAVE